MRKSLIIGGFVALGLTFGADVKPEVKKLSEVNLLKAQGLDKDKLIAQYKFNEAQTAAKQVSQDFQGILEKEKAFKAGVCKEAGYAECTYDTQTGVITEVKKAEEKKYWSRFSTQ